MTRTPVAFDLLPGTEQEKVLEKIEKVRRTAADGVAEPSRRIDPYDVNEAFADSVEGRDRREPKIWTQVMEAHGYAWFEPEQLNRILGPMTVAHEHVPGIWDPRTGLELDNHASFYTEVPHKEGQWRRSRPTKSAFTIRDLCALFRDPEDFDRWVRHEDLKARARRAGVVLPKRGR